MKEIGDGALDTIEKPLIITLAPRAGSSFLIGINGFLCNLVIG
jgi:hypothetical protein